MHFEVDSRGALSISSRVAALRQALPVLNGTLLQDGQSSILDVSDTHITVQFHAAMLGQGAFVLQVNSEPGSIWMRYWLEGLPADFVLDDFGLRFQEVENLHQYLCSGYFSWDGSFYVQPDALGEDEPGEARPEISYALTQILPRRGAGSLVIGFERHDRFQHTLTFDTHQALPGLTVLTLWDRKNRADLSRCTSERLVIFESAQVEDGLRQWARLVAAASPLPPRLAGAPITGWCSWYNLYAAITEENILHHLQQAARVAREAALPMRVFQIDDGFTPEMGDWLEVKPQFPRGMQAVLDDIRKAGFIPGLWIAPFMVGNRSKLYQRHPDWVVRDRQTGGPLVQMAFYGEFRWHKRSEEYYILDTTRPEAFEYLRQVFRIWRREWGCEYFKTDFMHFGAAHGAADAIWHTPGYTRIEIWRQVAEMIRQEIGAATWLGCGFPLWSAVGLVDGVRIGRDVGVDWGGNYSAQSLLRDQATRNFANQILWQADPDCVLLRWRYHHLAEHELRSLALFAGISGGVMMTSDDLGELPADRLRLWKLILSARRTSCSYPFLGQSQISYSRLPAEINSRRTRRVALAHDPVLVQVRVATAGSATVLFFNSGEAPVQRNYSVTSLGLSEAYYTCDWLTGECSKEPVRELSVQLAAHDSLLLFLSQQSFQAVPDTLDL